jgi:cyclase
MLPFHPEAPRPEDRRRTMARPTYTQGLHDLGNSIYAYLQPEGSWGWSNAGLIVDGDQSLLVDTLFDLRLTHRMLDDMRRVSAAAEDIDVVVNTHANGDHCWGNELVSNARIIASAKGAQEMAEIPPGMLAMMMKSAPSMGELGQYLSAIFGAFDFEGIKLTPPTETFEGTLDLRVGDKEVRLIEVGPAHTRGDVLVHVPADRVVFTGDILFNQIHPVIWAGPAENWIAACDTILDLDVEVVVPGHGALADKRAVREFASYLDYLLTECRERHQAGMSVAEAARDISLDAYASWSESERIFANVNAIYRSLGAGGVIDDVVQLFTGMSKLAHEPGFSGPS